MSSFYKISSGVDLATLFNKYISGTQSTATGYLDLSGNDFSTMFAPYVSGPKVAETGYKISSGADLNTIFAPVVYVPNFPTSHASVLGVVWVWVDTKDGVNCVMSMKGGGYPSGDPYTYLYWSDNGCITLNKATIGGSVIKFFGSVTISGANAIAMGYTGSNSTKTFYLSNDYGHSYTVTPTSGQFATYGAIAMDGPNAIFGGGIGMEQIGVFLPGDQQIQ